MITKEDIKAARKGAVTLGKMDGQDRHDALEGILKRTYALKGYSVEGRIEEEVLAILSETEAKICSRHNGLTLGEVALAWEFGVCGDFGDDKRITIANLLTWTAKYSQLPERRDAIEDLYRENRPNHLLPAEDVERRNRDTCRRWALSQWEHFKEYGDLEGGLLDGLGASIYDYLESLRKVNPSESTKIEARRKAEARIKGKGPSTAISFNLATEKAEKTELLRLYFSALKSRGVELRV